MPSVLLVLLVGRIYVVQNSLVLIMVSGPMAINLMVVMLTSGEVIVVSFSRFPTICLTKLPVHTFVLVLPLMVL